MTHPLTPREKVAAAIEKFAVEMGDIVGNEYGYADAILTALTSGSGDHAELERLKSAMSKSNDEICQSLGKALGYP